MTDFYDISHPIFSYSDRTLSRSTTEISKEKENGSKSVRGKKLVSGPKKCPTRVKERRKNAAFKPHTRNINVKMVSMLKSLATFQVFFHFPSSQLFGKREN